MDWRIVAWARAKDAVSALTEEFDGLCDFFVLLCSVPDRTECYTIHDSPPRVDYHEGDRFEVITRADFPTFERYVASIRKMKKAQADLRDAVENLPTDHPASPHFSGPKGR
jgi:hypothetical protein